jgi:hypothetical protein
MRMMISIIFIFCLRLLLSCECEHVYDEDVIALIDAEGDCYSDEGLYRQDNPKTQMQYSGPKPEKILQQAQYAFDTFRYNKCIEKIKEYERVAFPPPYDFPSPQEKLVILAYKAYSNRFLKKYDSALTILKK